MNIPNLPTDNLYKFIAISGVFIFLFSALAPLQKQYELGVLQAENRGLISMIQEKISRLKKMSTVNPELLSEVKDLHDKSIKTEVINESLIELQNKMRGLRNAGLIFGFLLMIIGFSLWFWLVQRHHDRLLATKTNDT